MPGVPPNAFAKLKQAFKGMLKSKKRQSTQDQQPYQKQEDQPDAATSRPDVPPKQLPPTHPLATGQHEEPLSAVPKPETGSAPVAGSGGAVAATEQLKRQSEDTAPVSPADPTPVAKDGPRTSDPVSAVSSDHDKPLPLPKPDGAADEVKPAAPLPSQPSTETPQPTTTTSENIKPASTTPVSAPAPATDIQPAAPKPSSIIDEKMTVMAEEPPEIKAKAAAPGMSATSGPLDDFPMEGDKP